MSKRWLCLLVENEVGVLARISGLFSCKNYNIDSISVGLTEKVSISRVTISLTSDDKTFEQIKKQLNRCVEVIKVISLSNEKIHQCEILIIKIINCDYHCIDSAVRFAQIFSLEIIYFGIDTIIIKSSLSAASNDIIVNKANKQFGNNIEIIRGGCVAIELI